MSNIQISNGAIPSGKKYLGFTLKKSCRFLIGIETINKWLPFSFLDFFFKIKEMAPLLISTSLYIISDR
jgi:hypothetical protein